MPAEIVFAANSGCTWAQVPPVFGPPGATVHRRFALWSRARVWAKLRTVLLVGLVLRVEWTGRAVRDRLGEHASDEMGR